MAQEKQFEIWKPIKGAPDYHISSLGRVKSLGFILNNGSFRPGKILKPYSDPKGYLKIELHGHIKKVHRLVAEAFIPNYLGKPQVNHIDGNKENNNVVNLEWATNAENTQHAYDTGLYKHKGVNYGSRKTI